jgi:glycosyltransferase involved in cell wall biosynthesis
MTMSHGTVYRMEVICLVESMEHVCCRYRLRQFQPYLAGRGVQLQYRELPRGSWSRWRAMGTLLRGSAILHQRRLLDPVSVRLLRRRAQRLLYDFDDALLYRDSHQAPHFVSLGRTWRFRSLMAAADTVLAGNAYLAELAAAAGAKGEIHVIPTCVDVLSYPLPDRPERVGRDVRLVWIGSSRTLLYLEGLRPVLEKVCRAVPGLKVRVICDRFPAWGTVPVEQIRWSERTERQALAEADIGMAPLPDDPWTRGKCGLKVLQYMACGLPVVASPVGVQASLVVDGVTGFLARDPRDWVDAIVQLVQEPALRHSMGLAGRERALAHYDVRVWAPVLARLLQGQTVEGRRECQQALAA